MDATTLAIAILSAFVALTGGIPGILGIIDVAKANNKLIWVQQHLIHGKADQNETFIMLSGHVANKGRKPIFTHVFELYYRHGRRWVQLRKVKLEPGLRFPSDSQNLQVDDPAAHDLQGLEKELVDARPIFGHLMYFLPASIAQDFLLETRHRMKMVCHDSVLNKHVLRFEIGSLNAPDSPEKTIYPRIGIRTQKKPE